MAVEIIHDRDREIAAMVDNTTGVAFGPVFQGPGCAEDAQDFLDWLRENPQPDTMSVALVRDGTDPREYSDDALATIYQRWMRAADNRAGV